MELKKRKAGRPRKGKTVRDTMVMVFMNDEVRMRHTAKPGLSGLAQVNGRNAIAWDEKFRLDLEYIGRVSFLEDFKLLLKTIFKVFGHKETQDELEVTYDYGVWLMKEGKISKEYFQQMTEKARNIEMNYN